MLELWVANHGNVTETLGRGRAALVVAQSVDEEQAAGAARATCDRGRAVSSSSRTAARLAGRVTIRVEIADGSGPRESANLPHQAVSSPAAAIAATASRSSSGPGSPLTPTAPTRRPSENAATPPWKNENCGSKLASSVGCAVHLLRQRSGRRRVAPRRRVRLATGVLERVACGAVHRDAGHELAVVRRRPRPTPRRRRSRPARRGSLRVLDRGSRRLVPRRHLRHGPQVARSSCARKDSNLRPRAPEARALSPELRARGGRSSRGRRAGRMAPESGASRTSHRSGQV